MELCNLIIYDIGYIYQVWLYSLINDYIKLDDVELRKVGSALYPQDNVHCLPIL